MATMPKAWYVEQAKRMHPNQRGENFTTPVVELNRFPDVSMGSQPGAWVEAWVWVPDPDAEAVTDLANAKKELAAVPAEVAKALGRPA